MEDYNEHWKDIRVKDVVVLDLGCDSGSTAKFFLSKGAKAVWGVEYVHSCAKLAMEENVKSFYYIQMNIDSSKKLYDLINTIKPDTVKVDIEGAEKFLLELDDDTLKIPSEWYIEGHTIYLYKKLMKMFSKLGFIVIDRYPIPNCPSNRQIELRDSQYITLFICRRQ